MTSKGNGWLGSDKLQVSTANKEMIPQRPPTWSHGYKIRALSFDNKEDCRIILDGKVTLFLKAGQGFEMGYDDPSISSFIIVEAGISFNWIATY